MNDVATVLRAHLVANCATVVALTSTRIYRETFEPSAAGWKPSTGAALCFQFRPGAFETEEDGLIAASVQFACWAKDKALANDLYQALVTDLQQGGSGDMRYARFTALGETFTHPDTGWPFVRCVARVLVAKD